MTLRIACLFALIVFASLGGAPAYAVNPEAQSAFDRGKKAKTDKKWEEAVDAFSEAIALDPNWRDPYYQRAWVYNETSKPQRALPDLAQVIRIDPKWADGWAERSWTYHALKNYKRALADINRAIALDPKSAEHLRNKCRVDLELNAVKAVQDCTASLKLSPGAALTLEYRGFAYKKLSQWSNAIADFEASLKADPNDAHVPPALAEVRAKINGSPSTVAATPAPAAAPRQKIKADPGTWVLLIQPAPDSKNPPPYSSWQAHQQFSDIFACRGATMTLHYEYWNSDQDLSMRALRGVCRNENTGQIITGGDDLE